MKRKHKTYSRPKRPFEKTRIIDEGKIKKDFGLKNKKEIWKAEAKINSIREKAKKLISANPEDQEIFFKKLQKIGLNVNSIADVLALTKEDYLNKRLQTIISKKFKLTIKTARQLITHKKVLIDGKVVNIPSYIVPVNLEEKITLKEKKKKLKEEIKKAPKMPVKEEVNKEEVSGEEQK